MTISSMLLHSAQMPAALTLTLSAAAIETLSPSTREPDLLRT